MTAEVQPFSAQLIGVWQELFEQLVDSPGHDAVALTATDRAGRWRETITFDDAVRVNVGYRLTSGDPRQHEDVPLTTVWQLPVSGARDLWVTSTVADAMVWAVAMATSRDTLYVTMVGDPGTFGRLAWSDTPAPAQVAVGAVESVLDIESSGDAVGQQMEDAAFTGVQGDALNRMGQAKKEIRRRYNSAKRNTGGFPSSSGNEQIRSVVRFAIADTEMVPSHEPWPGPEFIVIENGKQGSVVLAESAIQRQGRRRRSQMVTRVDEALSLEAFGATKPEYLTAQQWKASYSEDFVEPHYRGKDMRAARAYGPASTTEYDLATKRPDDIAIDRIDALDFLGDLTHKLTKRQIQAFGLSADLTEAQIAKRLGVSQQQVSKDIRAVRREISGYFENR